MVFVKPSSLSYTLVPIVQKFGTISALLSLNCFVLFFMEGLIDLPLIPQVDRGNPYFSAFNFLVPSWLTLGDRVYDKILFNSILVQSFWWQHSIMSRSQFKDYMNKVITNNQYFFYEKPLFALASAFQLSVFLMFHEPIAEIKLWQGTKQEDMSDIFNMSMIFTTFFMLIIGFFYLGVSMIDMWEQDLFGILISKYLQKNGLEFPRPFEMKRLSRVALSCRNPLMTGMILAIISPLFYPLNNGMCISRMQTSVLYILGILMGVFFEQREVRKAMGPSQYQAYCKIIPNALIPNISVLFLKSEADLEDMRSKVIKASKTD